MDRADIDHKKIVARKLIAEKIDIRAEIHDAGRAERAPLKNAHDSGVDGKDAVDYAISRRNRAGRIGGDYDSIDSIDNGICCRDPVKEGLDINIYRQQGDGQNKTPSFRAKSRGI